MRYLYLHGFASSPLSRKARAFEAALRLHGITLAVPALEQDGFENMTISSQLSVVEGTLQGEAARLIGSSMGGYLAALYAAAHPEVDRVVLLAPAFQFARRWREIAGVAKIRQWEKSGGLDVYHYGTGSLRRIGYELYEDALRYPPEPDFHQRALIFHGVNDATVPVQFSREFAGGHSNAELRELDSDHELGDVLEEITDAAVPFLLD